MRIVAASRIISLLQLFANTLRLVHCCIAMLMLIANLLAPFSSSSIAANYRTKLSDNSILSSKSRSKLLENSPIFFLKLATSSNSHYASNRYPSLMNNLNSLLGKRNSNLYKLPLQFVSNAKPVDIIHGIKPTFASKVPYKMNKVTSFSKFHKPSKMIFLPTKYTSNGRPIKPIVLSFAKRKTNFGTYHHHHHGYKTIRT